MLPSGDMLETAVENQIWRALADPVRRAILDQLAEGPKTTGDLVAYFDHLSRTAVMKHLEILVSAGIVIVARSGRTRWNHINPVPLLNVCERWLTGHTKRMSKALQQLKRITELAP